MTNLKRNPSKTEKSVALGKAMWLAAMRWRRVVDRELTNIDMTFTQYLVLDATDELIRETDDAVSQNAVAARIELDKMTVSQVMRTLDERGLVDRGPSLGSSAYRILLTSRGRTAIASARACVKTACHRHSSSR
jgi:DNA-binding MarR family transcriptional regulator